MVEDAYITDITVNSYEDDAAYFTRAQDAVISEMIRIQSLDVQAVSGATFSSNSIMDAVADALGISSAGQGQPAGGENDPETGQPGAGGGNGHGSGQPGAGGGNGSAPVRVSLEWEEEAAPVRVSLEREEDTDTVRVSRVMADMEAADTEEDKILCPGRLSFTPQHHIGSKHTVPVMKPSAAALFCNMANSL